MEGQMVSNVTFIVNPTLFFQENCLGASISPKYKYFIVKVSYFCPRECQSCQYFKDKTKVCMAFDEFGEIKIKAYDALPTKAKEDFDIMKNTTCK